MLAVNSLTQVALVRISINLFFNEYIAKELDKLESFCDQRLWSDDIKPILSLFNTLSFL